MSQLIFFIWLSLDTQPDPTSDIPLIYKNSSSYIQGKYIVYSPIKNSSIYYMEFSGMPSNSNSMKARAIPLVTISILVTRVLYHFVVRVKTVFGKYWETFVWPSKNFWIIFGKWSEIIGNHRKIVKLSLLVCICL